MELHGWGRFPRVSAELFEPASVDLLRQWLQATPTARSIPRGNGRSYGDSALAASTISSRFLDSFVGLDSDAATVHCGAGVTLGEVLDLCQPAGWLLPVLPGTRFVSIGGAIAADIHGKNHHLDGSFCDHIKSFSLMLASGEVLRCSPEENSELFRATCGGMGLTGVILDAVLGLERVPSDTIIRQTLVARNLQHCLELLEANSSYKYSVAWVDCLARGAALGRGVVHLGQHGDATSDAAKSRILGRLAVPFSTPALLLNRFSMSAFNGSYYHLKNLSKSASPVSSDAYFFPLDNIRHWNRLYGRRGFLQYQFVLPLDATGAGLRQVLQKVSDAGKGSFFSVLKRFGAANENLLSFPRSGFTLTLDFKYEESLFPLLDELDAIVIAHGGRHYLAKDARLPAEVFRAGYPDWERFAAIKESVDPQGCFASYQSQRLGLTRGSLS